MAIFHNSEINVGTLTQAQRDALLAQLLAERRCEIENQAPTPSSDFGQRLLYAAETVLSEETEYGALSDAINGADSEVEVGYDDALWWHVDETSHSIADDIRRAITVQISRLLTTFGSGLEREIGGTLDDQVLKKVLEGVDHPLSSDAFRELNAALEEKLPTYVQDSVSWSFDMRELNVFLEYQIEVFLRKAILPAMARNICNAEIELAPQFDALSTLSAEEG
jgi:hypothetical protein